MTDNHIKETLPPVINAVFNLVPPLLATIIDTQNRLLGISYTTIHQYCSDNDLPSPPPPMETVVEEWESAFGPIQKEIEAFYIIKSGRATRQTPKGANGKPPLRQAPSFSKNGISRAATGLMPGKGDDSRRPSLTPSAREESPPPMPGPRPGPPKASASYAGSGVATDFTLATKLSNSSAVSSPGPRGPADQYGYMTRRQTSDLAASVAGKKKPPPPPPKKFNRPPEESVVALYDFAGEGHGDLSFQEGDTIKIVKKTETEQDWWVGELRGVRGSFPANYCKPV